RIRVRRRRGRGAAGDGAGGAYRTPRAGGVGAGRRGARRAGVLHRRPAVHLPGVVVLDELADVVRNPPRDPDSVAVGDLRAGGTCRAAGRSITPARAARPAFAVRVLDSRRAGVRLFEL